MPNDWLADREVDRFEMMTGPATHRKPPQMGRGDRVLFHAVTHVRLFAEGEIMDNPTWKKNPQWGLRWPWVYPCRIDVWVPLIEHGVASSEVIPKRPYNRIKAGGDFAKLSREEYEAMRGSLLELPEIRQRRPSGS